MVRTLPVCKSLFVLFAFLSGGFLLAEQDNKNGLKFSFQLNEDEVLIVDKHQEILFTSNSSAGTREEKNRIVLSVTGTDSLGANLNGKFHTYFRTPAGRGPFKKNQDFVSQFRIQKNGEYLVPDQYIMPNLRSLPSFPDRPISVGDRWEMPGMETLDEGGVKVKLPVKVKYHYAGPDRVKNYQGKMVNAHKIEFAYQIDQRVRTPVYSKVRARSTDEMWYDQKNGIPVYDEQTIAYTFTLNNGREVTGIYKILSWYTKIKKTSEDKKEQLVADISDDLEKDDPRVKVRKSDEGIVLDLSDILFDFNSAQLTKEAQATVATVARILKKYEDREIRVSGHTDSTGSASYNQKLSEARAKTVVNELQQKHGLSSYRMSYKGYGKDRPVASNATKEGRAMNRRVEVLIVTE